jgi:hypothetical protein
MLESITYRKKRSAKVDPPLSYAPTIYEIDEEGGVHPIGLWRVSIGQDRE